MKKKVCHISTAHSDKDVRIVFKEAKSLREAGYEVYYIVTSDSDKVIDGINIRALPKNKNRFDRMYRLQREALKRALEVDAELYHFHDPELIFLGKKLKKYGKKVIYDVHEDMQKQILSKPYIKSKSIKKLISETFTKFEKTSAKKFDAIIVTLDEFKDKFNHYNDEIISVKNFARKDVIDSSKILENLDKYKGELTLLYIGSITKIRGIEEMIKATEAFDGNVKLWLMGPWESEDLRESCIKINGYRNCVYLGVKYAADIYSYVKSADVGLSILHPTANYKESIPTKVFEYMACGLPIILSDFDYWKKLFGNVGTYVNPLDIEDITRAIEYCLNNKDKLSDIGKLNRINYEKNFSWDIEEKKLIDLYDKLLSKG